MRGAWISIFAVIAVLAVTVATIPWWLGFALSHAGGRYGVTFSAYHRVGYAHFVVEGIRVDRSPVVVRISRIEAATPLWWAWRHTRGGPTPVSAGDWSVDVQRRTTPVAPTPSGWLPLRAQLVRIAAQLDRWLPSVETGSGVVRWPNGEIALKSARWDPGTLHVTALTYCQLSTDAKLSFRPDDVIRLSASTPASGAAAALESRGAALTGTVSWWNQRAGIHAAFAAQGWVPTEARVEAPSLNIPGAQLKLGAPYARVTGQAFVAWRTDHFFADIDLKGEPAPGKSAPPLDVVLRGRGDARTFTVDALHLALPGTLAELSAPVTLDRAGRFLAGQPNFAVRADLSKLPWVTARGSVSGQARVVSTLGQRPIVEFEITATDLAAAGVNLTRGELSGRLVWPTVTIARATLTDRSGEVLEASGGWNFVTQQVLDGVVHGTVRRDTLARWVPPAMQFDRATAAIHVSGPLAKLEHSGRMDATDVRYGSLNPMSLNMTWRGEGTEVASFAAALSADGATVSASGSADASGVQVRDGQFVDAGKAQLTLVQPVQITWRPTMMISAVHLKGPSGSVDGDLTWGTAGKIELAVHDFRSAWLARFVPLRGLAWTIDSFALAGTWRGAAMNYTTAGGVTIDLGAGRVGTINLAAHGGGDGLQIDALHAVESGHDVVNASGRLPLTISPGMQPLGRLEPTGPIQLEASTVPNAAFWQELAETTGIELRDPEVSAHVSGTWMRPRGTVAMRATRLAMDPKRFARPWPNIEDIDLAVVGEIGEVRLDRFSFKVEGQLVRASGRLPVPQRGWSELARDPVTFLGRGASVRLEVPAAEVAMFSRFLPAALAPVGRLQADVRYDRGALGGYLRLRDAASRPLGPLGVLQGVSADVTFSEHRIIIERVVATTGGEPISLSGKVELPSAGWLGADGGELRYDLVVHGKNLPFVRQAGLLVRGDLDLKLQTPKSGAPRISGQVTLRDSLFLADVRSFLPHGGGASPSRRPPYFSVDTPPLNTWALDVDVAGTRFMRLRTPVFAGVASTHFHLGGTLGEPRAIGDATVDEGQVLMPFATFSVTQGAVHLSEENPAEPTIFLRGTGRHFGYDLTLEVTGKASSPDITFRSSPALDPDQVLLMVMTGAAPTNEVTTSVTHRALQLGAFFGQSLLGGIVDGGANPDRLSFESGEKISQQGGETYDIEYKLNDRWTLTGEYDEFDEYNVGLKWRIAPKKLRK